LIPEGAYAIARFDSYDGSENVRNVNLAGPKHFCVYVPLSFCFFSSFLPNGLSTFCSYCLILSVSASSFFLPIGRILAGQFSSRHKNWENSKRFLDKQHPMNYLTRNRFVISRFEVLSTPALIRRMRSGRRVGARFVSPVTGFSPAKQCFFA
jgi:hypothetical protein